MADVRFGSIVLQKSFCGMGLKFSEAWARGLNNDVGDYVARLQTHRRVWQRVCGSIERQLSLVSFFGENLAAAAFGTFATLSALFGPCAMSDLSPECAPKRTAALPMPAKNAWHVYYGDVRVGMIAIRSGNPSDTSG